MLIDDKKNTTAQDDKVLSVWGKNNGLTVIFVIYFACFFLGCFGYYTYVAEHWGYYGFGLRINELKLFESLIMLALIVFLLPFTPKKPSDFLIHIHVLLPVLPMLILYALVDYDRFFMYSVFVAFCLVILVRNVPLSIPRMEGIESGYVLIGFCLFVSYVVILSIIALGGLKYLNFNIFNVYEYRRDASAHLPSIFGYISPIVSKVLLPFALVISLKLKKRGEALLSIGGSVLMFSLTNHKGPLFYPFFVLFLYYFVSNRNMVRLLLLGFMSVLAISVIASYFESLGVIPSLILRRVFFVPANANFGYWEFFSNHPHTYMANSKITLGLLHYPYDLPPPLLIGEYYWGDDQVSANTGWLGTGYMHFGYPGILLFGVTIGLILALIDSLAMRVDTSLVTALVTVPCFSLFLSTDIPTAFLTHGLFLVLMLLWLLPDSRATKKKRPELFKMV